MGAVLFEVFFWFTLEPSTYWNMVPLRGLIYAASLVMFYPLAARFARERRERQQELRPPGAAPAPAEALAVRLPENITVYYRSAPVWRRIAALVVDAVFVAVLSAVWWFVMALAYDVLRIRVVATLGMELGVLIVPLVYFVYTESTSDGQTPGKRQAGIRAIHESGRALTLSEVFARNILRPLLVLPPFTLVEALCVRTNGWRQRLGDLAASSVVIVDPR